MFAAAYLGKPEISPFAEGDNLAAYIAKKCGQPSQTVLVHPAYVDLVLQYNPNLRGNDLSHLPLSGPVTLPACVPFADSAGKSTAAHGLSHATSLVDVPFDIQHYRSLFTLTDTISRARNGFDLIAAAEQLPIRQAGPEVKTLRRLVSRCRSPSRINFITLTDYKRAVLSYFACINAVEIVAGNSTIRTADFVTGSIFIPAPAWPDSAQPPVARIEIDPGKYEALINPGSGSFNLALSWETVFKDSGTLSPAPTAYAPAPPRPTASAADPLANAEPPETEAAPAAQQPPAAPTTAGLRNIESPVKFVTAVETVNTDACKNGAEKISSEWPLNVAELLRALHVTGFRPSNPDAVTRVLIVDTGFDFAGTGANDDSVPPHIRLRFPEPNLHRTEEWNEVGDRPRGDDLNDDGVPNNHKHAGVNLSGIKGSASAATSVLDAFRSHGLSVTTLALGGRGLEHLRRVAGLPVKVGFVNLVPHNTPAENMVINQGHITASLKYAASSGNDFRVINLSLGSRQQISGLEEMLKEHGRNRIVVVAAGNDRTNIDLTGNRVWPASLGGMRIDTHRNSAVVITVGAHDAKNELAEFSNYGPESVDILAPGCMVGTYELDATKPDLNIRPANVSGTSFAAPTVSFVAATLLARRQIATPIQDKNRIQATADFNPDLFEKAYSSGTLNAAKALAVSADILQYDAVDDTGANHRVTRYGLLKNFNQIKSFRCTLDDIDFESIVKLARHPKGDYLFVLAKKKNNPAAGMLTRMKCLTGGFDELVFMFLDKETDIIEEIRGSQIFDYVPRL
ncbi:MAG: S8 family serine peptidase [Hoeflea sp.]